MKRTKKGFTLVELLVVIAIIALLVSILMPALGRAREMANRLKCSTQLRGIGTAIALYQNDFKDSNPVIGDMSLSNSRFGSGALGDINVTPFAGRWMNQIVDMNNKEVLTEMCLYLLVKYEDLIPKIFLCPSADNVQEMDLQEAIILDQDIENWDDLNHFWSSANNSYSYNDPYNALLDASSSSALIISADRNPKFDDDKGLAEDVGTGNAPASLGNNATDTAEGVTPKWDWTDDGGDNPDHGNSLNHATEMQNVLFVDTHVKKYNDPLAGIANDNIFTYWSALPATVYLDKTIGLWAPAGGAQFNSGQGSRHENDTYLGN